MQEPMIFRRAALGAVCLALLGGCAGSMQAQQAARPHPEPYTVDPALTAPPSPQVQAAPVTLAVPEAQALEPAEPAGPVTPVLAAEPPAPLATVAIVPKPAVAPREKVLQKPAATPAIVEAAPRPAVPVAPALPLASTEGTLDLANLRARLRDTKAIGVFAKLSIEKEVDELQERFRVLYASGKRAATGSLRQPFDTLVQKVIGLIKDGDPSLATMVSRSREAIWDYLVHPEKFSPAGS